MRKDNKNYSSIKRKLLDVYEEYKQIKDDDYDQLLSFFDRYSFIFANEVFKKVKLDSSYPFDNFVDYMNNELINFLNKPADGLPLGDRLIQFSILKYSEICQFLYYWDFLRVKKELNINEDLDLNIKYFNNKKDCCGACYEDDGKIDLNLVSHHYRKDAEFYNLFVIRHELKHYAQYFNYSDCNELEKNYYDFCDRLLRIYSVQENEGPYDKLHDFFPIEFDSDLYAASSMIKLLSSYLEYNNPLFVNQIDEYDDYLYNRDVSSDQNYNSLLFLNINGIDQNLLGNDYVDRYCSCFIDNCTNVQDGYDKANLLPFVYIIIDYTVMAMKNGVIECNYKNCKLLYEAILKSQEILKLFPEYKNMIKSAMYDEEDNLKPQFLSFKLYDIYNDCSEVVEEWASQNYITDFEYNSDYYKGDMKKELDTMYLMRKINSEMTKSKRAA